MAPGWEGRGERSARNALGTEMRGRVSRGGVPDTLMEKEEKVLLGETREEGWRSRVEGKDNNRRWN